MQSNSTANLEFFFQVSRTQRQIDGRTDADTRYLAEVSVRWLCRICRAQNAARIDQCLSWSRLQLQPRRKPAPPPAPRLTLRDTDTFRLFCLNFDISTGSSFSAPRKARGKIKGHWSCPAWLPHRICMGALSLSCRKS